MKAILEFNLPEDAEDHRFAVNGAKYYFVIEGALSFIRQKLKYGNLPEDQEKLLEELRDHIKEERGNED